MELKPPPTDICHNKTGMAPILMILGMAAITYGYYTYIIDKTEREYSESDEDSDDGSEELDEGTHDKIPHGCPEPRWPHNPVRKENQRV